MKTQVVAARTKETTTAGPASATLSERPTKMPVPTIAPTPKQTSWKSPIVRLRPCPSRSVPDSASSSSGLLTRAPGPRDGLMGVRGLWGPGSCGRVSSLARCVGATGCGVGP